MNAVLSLKYLFDYAMLNIMEYVRLNKNLQSGIRNQLIKDFQWDNKVYQIILSIELELKKMRKKNTEKGVEFPKLLADLILDVAYNA